MIPRKLSKETLDILFKEVEEYSQTTSFRKLPYTYADGTTVNIAPALLANASTPFFYLITQTYPYHARSHSTHLMTDLMFIVTEDGKKTPWTRDAKDMQYFMQTAYESMGLCPTKGVDGKSRFIVGGALKLTFNNERTGQYERDFMQTAYESMGLRPLKAIDGKSIIITDDLKPTFYNEKTGQYEHEIKIKMTPEEIKERIGKIDFNNLENEDLQFSKYYAKEILEYSSYEEYCKLVDAMQRGIY